MFKSLFFVTIIFVLFSRCASHRHPSSMVFSPTQIPQQWQAREYSSDEGLVCSPSKKVSDGHWWNFCFGEKNQQSHGVLQRFNGDRVLVSKLSVPSIDRLAQALSLSPYSEWVEHNKFVYVTTQDGRILKFDLQGNLVSQKLISPHAWVQHIQFVKDSFYVTTSKYKEVKLIKFDDDLDVIKEVKIERAQHESEWVWGNEGVFVATDSGHLYSFDFDLKKIKNEIQLSEASLGVPTIYQDALWVGSYRGELIKFDFLTELSSKIVLGKTPISFAPISTSAGLWIAQEDEGLVRLIDSELKLKKTLRFTVTRSLSLFEAVAFHEHTLLSVASQGRFHLLTSEGEMLFQIHREGSDFQTGVGLDEGKFWLGETGHPLKWEILPMIEDTLMSERAPASTVH
ncbi:MAG: hypothetical protein K2P81_07045 [Bacteriovoracaceae bacterium]|nr:hypothetical protein [Bacteriovoracaceae bacterium]